MPRYSIDYFSKDVKELVQPNVYELKSRYDSKIRLRLKNDDLVVRTLKKSDLVANKTTRDIIHKIKPIERERPELVAQTYYGDARLYWIILAANEMSDRTEFKDGITIRIPSKQALYGTNGVMNR